MHRIVVSDTTAITHLAKIGHLHILQKLYTEILIPTAVYSELSQVKRTQPGALQVLNSPWIKVISVSNQAVIAKLNSRLDLGEAEAIALALEQNADVLIIDEVAGRAVAKQLGRKIIGMIGVLLEAKSAKIISEIRPCLEALNRTGFRMSSALFDLALQQAGESAMQSRPKS
jgi:hypothetical protein